MTKMKIHFIIEGQIEEKKLFELIEEQGQNKKIEISYKESKGSGNIAAYFQNELGSENYDLVYCVYDVDDKINDLKSAYNRTRNQLIKVLGSEKKVDEVSLCTNPNILLLILLPYDCPNNLQNLTPSKGSNTTLIKKYCPKIGNKQEYDGHEWQVDLIVNGWCDRKKAYERIIDSEPYLSKNYKKDKIASNLVTVLKEIKEENIAYFEKVIKIIKGEQNVNTRRKKKS